MGNLKHSHLIVQELKTPHFSPDKVAEYAKFATRVLWMDNNVVDGAFQMNCAWYIKPNSHISLAHTHTTDEIIGFFGSNPDDPYKLGAEIEFWLEDEKYILTKSSLIFVPEGLKHCPLITKRVDSPIFHFSILKDGVYKAIKNNQQ